MQPDVRFFIFVKREPPIAAKFVSRDIVDMSYRGNLGGDDVTVRQPQASVCLC